MVELENALKKKDLEIRSLYVIHGTVGYLLGWEHLDPEALQAEISKALGPLKDAFQKIPVTRGNRWGAARAPLETIITRMLPLLQPRYPHLQAYMDMWQREKSVTVEDNHARDQNDNDGSEVSSSNITHSFFRETKGIPLAREPECPRVTGHGDRGSL